MSTLVRLVTFDLLLKFSLTQTNFFQLIGWLWRGKWTRFYSATRQHLSFTLCSAARGWDDSQQLRSHWSQCIRREVRRSICGSLRRCFTVAALGVECYKQNWSLPAVSKYMKWTKKYIQLSCLSLRHFYYIETFSVSTFCLMFLKSIGFQSFSPRFLRLSPTYVSCLSFGKGEKIYFNEISTLSCR